MTVENETTTTTADLAVPPELEQVPVRELVDLLNDAFDVEMERRWAQLRSEPVVPDHDAGLRAAKGIMIAGVTGILMWAGILAALVALA